LSEFLTQDIKVSSASQIYHEAIKALATAAVGQGKLEAPSGSAFVDNPLCGDCVEMQVVASAGAITALAHQVRGCLLCRAAASLIGKHALGSRLADIERVTQQLSLLLQQEAAPPAGWEELAVFKPVHGHASRYRCVELPFHALAAAMRASA
jgi:nitrogen fixation NifU-like protein